MTESTVYLALGANLGDRAGNIHAALSALRDYVVIEETSFLYETAPRYITDQPEYLNATCRVRTQRSPQELLVAIETIMATLGRQRSIRYGPRVIDIDILFHDDQEMTTPDLTIPHPHLAERDFVLQPLCDIAAELRHPTLGLSMKTLWQRLKTDPLRRVMPFGAQLWTWDERTYIMGILNVTPDSFSGDGLGEAGEASLSRAVEQAACMIGDGADCLDIGGHSTRPGHGLLPASQEIDRVVPVIEALSKAVTVPLSVDTFRAPVARAALNAGAHAINDVWGLRFDRRIADMAAEHAVPLMLMHNRLAIDYWDRFETPPPGRAYDYTDIVHDVVDELSWSETTTRNAGLPRWSVVLDPGVGFGKRREQSLELIDRLNELRALGYPLLFGSSRKGFIGQTLGGLPADQRLEGSLATAVLAIDRGADIVRVHDVCSTRLAAQMADAIVRR